MVNDPDRGNPQSGTESTQKVRKLSRLSLTGFILSLVTVVLFVGCKNAGRSGRRAFSRKIFIICGDAYLLNRRHDLVKERKKTRLAVWTCRDNNPGFRTSVYGFELYPVFYFWT